MFPVELIKIDDRSGGGLHTRPGTSGVGFDRLRGPCFSTLTHHDRKLRTTLGPAVLLLPLWHRQPMSFCHRMRKARCAAGIDFFGPELSFLASTPGRLPMSPTGRPRSSFCSFVSSVGSRLVSLRRVVHATEFTWSARRGRLSREKVGVASMCGCFSGASLLVSLSPSPPSLLGSRNHGS